MQKTISLCGVVLAVFVCLLVGGTHGDNSIVEWKGTVFVNESITIQQDTTLVISDNTVVVFYANNLENATNPLTVTILGGLAIGSGVQLSSLNMVNGLNNLNTNTSFNTDQWGFIIPSNNSQLSSLNLYNVTTKKSDYIAKGTPVFLIQKSLQFINISQSEFIGGSRLFDMESSQSVQVVNSSVSNMQNGFNVVDGNTCEMQFSSCAFKGVGVVVNHRGSSVKVNNGVSMSKCTISNVGQGIYSYAPVNVVDTVFSEFKAAIISPNVNALRATFDNTLAINTAAGILNTINVDGVIIFDIQQSQFISIKGLVAVTENRINTFIFKSNVVKNCMYSNEFMNALIEAKLTVGSAIFQDNQITNCKNNGFYNVIDFGWIGLLTFTGNNLTANEGKSILSLGMDLSPFWKIERNIFNDGATVYGEILFEGKSTVTSLNITYNYWGSNVDKSQKLSTSERNNLISNKLNPSRYFKFIPYYLTSDVNDNDPSNIGGVNTDPSENPTIDGEMIGIIAGSVGGGILVIAIVVTICVVVGVVIYKKKHKANEEARFLINTNNV